MARRNPERRREWNRRDKLRIRYGLTISQYEAKLKDQGGVCAICRQTCKSGNRLAVDHSHSTGVVRGLLCCACNVLRGHLENAEWEWMTAAQSYLNQWSQKG